MAFFWKRKRKEMDIPPPPKLRISIPSDLPSFPSSMEEKLPPLPPLEKKPEPPVSREEAVRLPPMPKLEPLPPLPPLELEKEIRKEVTKKPQVIRPAEPHFFRPPQQQIREMPKPVIRQAVERFIPRIKEKPKTESGKIKRGLLRGKELFIEVEDYRIIFEILTNSRRNVSELSESMEKIEGFSEEEELALEKWQKGLEAAQKKLISIDKNLFK